MIPRRRFVKSVLATSVVSPVVFSSHSTSAQDKKTVASLPAAQPGEDIFAYIQRHRGQFDRALYLKILGSANEFKEGDEIIGVAAKSQAERQLARQLLSETQLSAITTQPPHIDELYRFIQSEALNAEVAQQTIEWTIGDLKRFLLTKSENEIHKIKSQLSSDSIGCVVKLCSNDELILIAQKIFNTLPGTKIGAKGYLGARVQPNSPTDNVDDIVWQVFNAWSFGVGDVLLGTNPVSSEPKSVAAVQRALRDVLATFGLESTLPHCVLSHIDVQAEVEKEEPGSTALWFQSIAGNDDANETFDISIRKMADYAEKRVGKFGLYFETGQGADFTNGHGHGFDMVLHESRKYGFARQLQQIVANARRRATPDGVAPDGQPWVHLNDVAGFIGPEVFRTREQLVRCCLEDIVMGKLHGLCIGLDVCSTLHMDVSLSDLDWCLDQIMPANPAYLMALPTKIDPMLGYLTTGYQDHVRLRDKFSFRVNDAMWSFFKQLDVIDEDGRPSHNFGDPNQVYLAYRKRKGDARQPRDILAEGRRKIKEVRDRGVFLSTGQGKNAWDLQPSLATEVDRIYAAAKKSIWAELDEEFVEQVPKGLSLVTQSSDRNDYILHPESGERLKADSAEVVVGLRSRHRGDHDVQVVVSDGLNALAIANTGQLLPFLRQLRKNLKEYDYRVAPENLVVHSGRVRAGYRIGETLFKTAGHQPRAVVHVIGERPGTGHDTFSAYITMVPGDVWKETGKVDHNVTKVVSGIALTAIAPQRAAEDVVRVLNRIRDAAS